MIMSAPPLPYRYPSCATPSARFVPELDSQNAPLPSTSSGRPSRLLRWKAEGAGFPKEEDSAGDEEEEDEEDDEDEEEGRLVYLTTSCITLEAFINAKVCTVNGAACVVAGVGFAYF